MARTAAFRMELSVARNAKDLHAAFKNTFGFFDGYGMNWDAWINCMSSIDDPGSGLTAVVVEPETTVLIELMGCDSLGDSDPQTLARLVQCAGDVNSRFKARGSSTRLHLVPIDAGGTD